MVDPPPSVGVLVNEAMVSLIGLFACSNDTSFPVALLKAFAPSVRTFLACILAS